MSQPTRDASGQIDWKIVFDAMKDQAMILDLDYRIVAANQATEKMTGLSLGQLVGRRCFEIFHGSDTPPAGCPYSILLGSGKAIPNGLEMEMESLGRTFLVSVTPLRGATGEMTGTLNVAKDITDLKRAEAILRRTLRVQRMITHCDQALVRIQSEEELLNAVCQIMIDQGGYRLAWIGFGLNDERKSVQIEASAGHDEGYLDLLNLTWEDSERGQGPAGVAIRTGKPVICRDIATDPQFALWREAALQRGFASLLALPLPSQMGRGVLSLYAPGNMAFSEEEIHLLNQLADDLAYGINAIRNQQAYRQAVASLEESEEKYRTLIANAHDAIILADAGSDRVLEANAAAERLLGRSQAEIVGMAQSEFCPGIDWETCHRIFTGQAESNEIIPEDVHILRGDGRLIPVQVSASLVTVGGKQVVQAIFRDIGQLRQAEERLRRSQKMESLGALAGGIAHDFNNILSPILGYAELCLSMIGTDDKLHAFVTEILSATHRAKELVRQIQTFSRKSEAESQPLLIQTIVKEALKFLKSSLPATIALQADIDAAGSYVLSDPAKIHQVVMALCTNAYQAMLAKGGTMQVSLKRVRIGEGGIAVSGLAPGPYLCLTVRDTGVGIARHDLPRVFEPYFTTKGPGEGTGMGLAVVDGIVRQCGGLVEVESELGQGAMFRVYLPEIVDEDKGIDEEPAIMRAAGNQRILLVDDDAVIVTAMERMLGTLGFQVTSAKDGQEALELFQRQPEAFALVLTDQTMPRLAGIDLARQILALRPGLPIIIFSGYEYLGTEEQLTSSGIKAFLRKPVGMSELARTINRVLAAK